MGSKSPSIPITDFEGRICVDNCNGHNKTKHKVTRSNFTIIILECLSCGSFMTII